MLDVLLILFTVGSDSLGPEELQLEIEKVLCSDRESATASLDMKMKNKLTNRLTTEGSQILKHLLTVGLLKPFPKNCISVMTTTGAKGSTVSLNNIIILNVVILDLNSSIELPPFASIMLANDTWYCLCHVSCPLHNLH